MVSVANLAIYQGDDYAAVVTVSDGTTTPPDLTGYTAQAQIRLGPADSNPAVAVEIATSLNLPNLIDLSIPHSITAQLSGLYAWDLQITAPSGVVETILAGNVVVTEEVTREGTTNVVAAVQGHAQSWRGSAWAFGPGRTAWTGGTIGQHHTLAGRR